MNHNIARNAHHEGSAEWFIRGNTYPQWKTSTGSLLWVHGKRVYIPFSHPYYSIEKPIFYSGVRKVRSFVNAASPFLYLLK
jgi:hypothetical protein